MTCGRRHVADCRRGRARRHPRGRASSGRRLRAAGVGAALPAARRAHLHRPLAEHDRRQHGAQLQLHCGSGSAPGRRCATRRSSRSRRRSRTAAWRTRRRRASRRSSRLWTAAGRRRARRRCGVQPQRLPSRTSPASSRWTTKRPTGYLTGLPGVGPEDGRLRADVQPGAAGHAGRHARAPGGAAAGSHRREGQRRCGAPAAHGHGRAAGRLRACT